VFGGAALWFLYRASAEPRGGGWYHAAMAASMTWMWASMSPGDTTAGMSMPSMRGTDMAGMDRAGDRSVARSEYLLIGAGVLYLVAAAWFAFVLIRALARTGRGAGASDSGANALMAAGMATYLLAAA
jgi:hypothetical protein